MMTKIVNALWIMVALFLFVGSLLLIRNGQLQEIVSGLGFWAPAILILLKISTLVVAPLGGNPIYIISGALYGNWVGFAIVMAGDILGSSICFWISRKFGEKVVKTLASEKLFEQVKKGVSIISETKSFAKARLGFASLPELLAYAAGLSKINFWKFTLINTLFYIPIDFALVFLGSQIRDLSVRYFFIIPALAFLAGIIGFGLLYKDFQKLEGN
jgi:uncharacterized membrane protein YdjX (TVP38/TMEM64 family)